LGALLAAGDRNTPAVPGLNLGIAEQWQTPARRSGQNWSARNFTYDLVSYFTYDLGLNEGL
jgi:hypothetical protein